MDRVVRELAKDPFRGGYCHGGILDGSIIRETTKKNILKYCHPFGISLPLAYAVYPRNNFPSDAEAVRGCWPRIGGSTNADYPTVRLQITRAVISIFFILIKER